MERHEALARRLAAQQLDRAPDPGRSLTDAAVLDLGVQDTGRDGAGWALVNRGVPLDGPAALAAADDLALVWTLRGAPHVYRRADLRGVLDATSPYDDADARRRTLDASRPLTAAGIGMREAMGVVATTMRAVVTRPTVKGELSGALAARLPEPYLRWCVPCQATHAYEQTFRLASLPAGLELEPGTSPPVLRRIPGWRRPPALGDPERAPAHLRVVDAYARLCGPTTPAATATFLDVPPGVVAAHWPEVPPPLPDPAGTEGLVRLLGPFDLWLQARDREVVVPEKSRHKALWPTLGRPGAVLVGTEVVGVWRPKASGRRLAVGVEAWDRVAASDRERVGEQAERLAAHRGVSLTGITWT
ncbi:Winged helix DNA-binding domain-containing protein [Microlunatus sagamiharensis]|uniref:Winged helix DNA-binding domain-containing protein n=1 Tax=Microlunatus sagamiharensis TaxID=546874 RepID=A0A1H2N4B5_9ACTN|nr:crosslink repair DNA glycosylase YcaQ family protein [Microlunatus sagamiharensis]SDU99991.1 Winged helix DNA-binding domain-containing protein [Microlunatus sagamiharensis]